MRVVSRINQVLHELMDEDSRTIIIGEDVCDPYGGAFKVTQGLSTAFPDRVMTTPISEAAIVGVATGMAMRGYRPIIEIMFGDFVTLAMDQILNHASKFPWVYNGQVSVPIIIRTPMGGRRGYGPTHSQSLEKHFCGIPGLNVLAINQFKDPKETFRKAYDLEGPCLIIENKVLYARPVSSPETLIPDSQPDLTIVTYGGCVEVAYEAAQDLRNYDEVIAEVLAIESLSPFPYDAVAKAAERSGCLLVIEEGTKGWGFAGECARAVVGKGIAFDSLAAPSHPIPNSRSWEIEILPSAKTTAQAALRLLDLDA